MSSRPQPVSESRPVKQRTQPVSRFESAAFLVRTYEAWSGWSPESDAKSRAAAAETCGAEKDVPSPRLNSIGPQSEYPCGVQPGLDVEVSARGSVEKIPSPGA